MLFAQETLLPVIFDSLYLYGMAANRTVAQGGNMSNGTEIREACQYMTFTGSGAPIWFGEVKVSVDVTLGKSGKILMNRLADRVCEYTVLSMDANNRYTPLLSIPVTISPENESISRVRGARYPRVSARVTSGYFV